MVKSKITVNWFVDFDKEEKWLNEMAGKGWALKSTNGVLYRFNQCRPGEFIYQIDFSYWLTEFSTGLTYGILLADILILLPILRKLNNKIKDLIAQIF